VQTERATNQSS